MPPLLSRLAQCDCGLLRTYIGTCLDSFGLRHCKVKFTGGEEDEEEEEEEEEVELVRMLLYL